MDTKASQLRYQQSLNCSALQLSVDLISLHFLCLNFMVILCSAVPWIFFLLNISTLVLCINHSYRKKKKKKISLLSAQKQKNNSWKKGVGSGQGHMTPISPFGHPPYLRTTNQKKTGTLYYIHFTYLNKQKWKFQCQTFHWNCLALKFHVKLYEHSIIWREVCQDQQYREENAYFPK